MLMYLDVLIGIAVIMLGGSLIITVATQALSNLFALRGRNLRWGLAVLIQELHPDNAGWQQAGTKLFRKERRIRFFGKDVNPTVSTAVGKVLTHPLVSESKLPLGWWQLATAIRFDEFVKTVALLGGPERPAPDPTLKTLSENNRITEMWFNAVMDRVSERFATHVRVYSIAVAAVLVMVAGIDTLHVTRVLQKDATIRSGLVSAAESIKTQPITEANVNNLNAVAESVVAQLREDSFERLFFFGKPFDRARLPGMFLSVVLLSLGAPFWFTALKNLTQLRSVVAKKEQAERAAGTPDVGDQIRWKDL